MTDCPTCKGEGWVCENHTDRPWGEGDGCCGGAGSPCPQCNQPEEGQFPRMSPGSVEIWNIHKGYVH